MADTATEKRRITFAKIKATGKWGVRVEGPPVRTGDDVLATRKDGKRVAVRIAAIVTQTDEYQICEVEGAKPAGRTRPVPPDPRLAFADDLLDMLRKPGPDACERLSIVVNLAIQYDLARENAAADDACDPWIL